MRKPFYGWIIVGVAFLIGMTEVGAFQNILAIFMKPMSVDFGWSRAYVTGAIAFGSICAGILSPFVGPVIDRHGPRMVAVGGILILSAGLVCMSFVSRIWHLYVLFGTGRMIAVGVLSLVIAVTVPNWFIQHRGRASGITWLGPRFGSAVLPAFAQVLILSYGWRMAWLALGILIFLISGIPSLLFLHRRPEDIGLLPDGRNPEDKAKAGFDNQEEGRPKRKHEAAEPAWTRAEAIRNKDFWLLTGMFTLIPFVQAGINFHIYPFLTDRGFNEMAGVLALSTIAVFGALGSLASGMFAERFKVQYLLTIMIFGNGLVFLMLFLVVEFRVVHILGKGVIFFLASLHGMLHGGRPAVRTIIWADFFGRESLGSIYGFTGPFRYTANALGPVFAAFCFDIFGNYQFPFFLFATIFFLSGTICLFLKPPQHAQTD